MTTDIVYPAASLGELERVITMLLELPGACAGVERDRCVAARMHQFVIRFGTGDTRVIVELSHAFVTGRTELARAVFDRVAPLEGAPAPDPFRPI